MPEGKWNAYEHDIRIPLVVAGPGIPSDIKFDFIASNVDTMPSIFGLVGVPTPASMDGRSFAHLLLTNLDDAPHPAKDLVLQGGEATKQWRTDQLIEYGGGGPVVRYEHLEDIHNNTFRCLRVVDSRPSATIRNAKLCEFVGWADWVRAHTSHKMVQEHELRPYLLHWDRISRRVEQTQNGSCLTSTKTRKLTFSSHQVRSFGFVRS